MNIGAISMGMSKASLCNAVSVSVLKISMNNESQSAMEMTDMINSMDVDTNRGMNIDARA